jgi:hypothetical protein
MVGMPTQPQPFIGNPAVRGMMPGAGMSFSQSTMGYPSGAIPQSGFGYPQSANYGMPTRAQTSLGMWQ